MKISRRTTLAVASFAIVILGGLYTVRFRDDTLSVEIGILVTDRADEFSVVCNRMAFAMLIYTKDNRVYITSDTSNSLRDDAPCHPKQRHHLKTSYANPDHVVICVTIAYSESVVKTLKGNVFLNCPYIELELDAVLNAYNYSERKIYVFRDGAFVEQHL